MKARLISALSVAAIALVATPFAAQAQPTDYNYVGLGAGVGNLGDSDVGLAVNGKFTVADHVSVRPGVISDLTFNSEGETVFLAPVTYDFDPITPNGKLLPFAGGGVSVSTEGAGAVGPLLTAGLDYRLNDQWVANGSVNWSLYGDSQVNGVIGIGYSF